MLRAHGRMLDDDCDEETESQLMFAGRPAPMSSGPQHEEALPARCARQEGYSLHAGRQVHENDRVGLEQLARYGLRPALSLERLSEAGDGTVLYEMKRRFSDGRQTLRFAPRELLLRLCALVPPRGFHMVRYHGIFAPHARGRFALTGRGMRDCPATPSPSDTAERAAPTNAVADAPGLDESPAVPSTASTRPRSTAAQPVLHDGAAWNPPDDATRARRLEGSLLMQRAYAHLLADEGSVPDRNACPASSSTPIRPTPSTVSTRFPSTTNDSVRASRRRVPTCALAPCSCT